MFLVIYVCVCINRLNVNLCNRILSYVLGKEKKDEDTNFGVITNSNEEEKKERKTSKNIQIFSTHVTSSFE